MTDRTNYCTGCKERQVRIEALTAEVKRRDAMICLLAERVDDVDENIKALTNENERLRHFIAYTADCCEDAHIAGKAFEALEKQP
jgi:hypothetical protein